MPAPVQLFLIKKGERCSKGIHLMNCYPVEKCWQNKPHYLLDSELTSGFITLSLIQTTQASFLTFFSVCSILFVTHA